MEQKREGFVERVGEFFSRLGYQRGAGRMIGWLLICDPPHQSATEIEDATGASKASVSIHLRLLTASGLVERIGLPGERKAYYRIRPTAWTSDLAAKLEQMKELKRIAEDGLERLGRGGAERRQRLERMRDFYAFMEAEMPAVIEKWNKKTGRT